MEYLTLQDIPHRHCEPLHSRKMTSSHSVERPLANMVAAVSEVDDSLSSPLPPVPALPPFLEPALSAPRPSLPGAYSYYGNTPSSRGSASEPHVPAPSLHHIQLRSHSVRCQSPQEDGRQQPVALSQPFHYEDRRRTSSPMSRTRLSPSPCTYSRRLSPDEVKEVRDTTFPPADTLASTGKLELRNSSSTLTDSQNHNMRSSPPIQPGEQAFPGKLPSFSEVCDPNV
jgi:hypothetical protein